MVTVKGTTDNSILMLIAGAKGAIGSTIAAAACAIKSGADAIAPYLTTENRFIHLGLSHDFEFAGWDKEEAGIRRIIAAQGILSDQVCQPYDHALGELMIKSPPSGKLDFSSQVEQLIEDIRCFKEQYPNCTPVFVNLLPAAPVHGLASLSSLEELYNVADSSACPDMTYVTAAVLSGIPVVNFTPNEVEILVILEEARHRKIPVSGRDGKTGQTYFKVVLASALKARNLWVDGWYSLNILGNAHKDRSNPPHDVHRKYGPFDYDCMADNDYGEVI